MTWWGYAYLAISFISFVIHTAKTKDRSIGLLVLYSALYALWPVYLLWAMFVAYKRVRMTLWIADRYMEKGGVQERSVALDMAKAGLDWAIDDNGLDGPVWAWNRDMANELADTDMSYWDDDAG